LCHVERTRAWARDAQARLWPANAALPAAAPQVEPDHAWSEVETRLFAGDPIERALAASALGRSVPAARQERRIALLLAAIEDDPYPAIRHLALRSARALLRHPTLEGFVPEQPQAARHTQLAGLRARFALQDDERRHSEALRAQAQALAIDIGE
jgi:hypothetical protein